MRRAILADRQEAGRLLAERLRNYRGQPDAIVVALPRGGVITGAEIARELKLPLDVLIVRKLGVPDQPELAMGAIASGGVRVLNPDVISGCRVTEQEIESTVARERAELERRERVYREGRPPADFRGRTVILADDGIATGATFRSAVAALRKLGACRIAAAAAVAPPGAVRELAREVDEVVTLAEPDPFGAISIWYQEFPQATDEQVCTALRLAIPPFQPDHPPATEQPRRNGTAR